MESDEFRNQILQLIPSGVGVYDVTGDQVKKEYLNDGYYQMIDAMRSGRSQYDGIKTVNAICRDDLPGLMSEAKASIAEKRMLQYTFRVIDGEGMYRWIAIRANHVPLNEKTERFYAAYYNVDELVGQLKNAETAFEEEKRRMKTFGQGILSAASFNVTKDTVTEVLNNESLLQDKRMKEYSPVRQNAETMSVLLNAAGAIPDIKQRESFIDNCSHEGLIRNFNEGKRQIMLEYRRMTSAGLIWVSTRVELLPDPASGDIIAYFYTTDINEQRIRQEATERLVDTNYTASMYIEKESGMAHIISGNDEYLMPGSYFDKKKLDDITEHLVNKERYTHNYTLKGPKDDNEKHDRRIQESAFYLDEEKRYIVFSRADVTEQYEQEQRQKEILERSAIRAEKASMAKTDFLSRMSHDIRTPLNGIIGMTALAKDEDDPEIVQEYLDKIDESGHFLLSLVNDILDMSKVESGKIELHPTVYSWNELYKYLLAVIQPLCDSRGIIFSIEVPDTTYTLRVDKLRFTQIFFNLLSNAVKFTPMGGHIVFRICNKKIADGYAEMEYSVIDDGIGMTKEFQRKMFDPFEQEKTDSNAIRAGSGLGLAIVKNMVDLMDGTIEVESSPGKGSSFRVNLRLPVVPDEEISCDEDTDTDILAGKRVLIAEDNAVNSEIVIKLLEKKGITADHAPDGAIAYQMFQASPVFSYDAILMDIRMPVMDGFQATQAIRSLNRQDALRIPIIALTANAFEEDIRKCLDAGMNAHIAKPVEPEQLYERLCRQIRDMSSKQ